MDKAYKRKGESMNKRWIPEEEQYLLDVYGKKPIEEITKKLKRTKSAITTRIHELRIKHDIIVSKQKVKT